MCVRWCDLVVRGRCGHILRSVLEPIGQRKKQCMLSKMVTGLTWCTPSRFMAMALSELVIINMHLNFVNFLKWLSAFLIS